MMRTFFWNDPRLGKAGGKSMEGGEESNCAGNDKRAFCRQTTTSLREPPFAGPGPLLWHIFGRQRCEENNLLVYVLSRAWRDWHELIGRQARWYFRWTPTGHGLRRVRSAASAFGHLLRFEYWIDRDRTRLGGTRVLEKARWHRALPRVRVRAGRNADEPKSAWLSPVGPSPQRIS